MNIGIVFVGISYGHGRDFRHCYENIKNNLLDAFGEDNSVSVYSCTYNSELNDELIQLFKPKKYTFLEFKDSHQLTTYKTALSLTLGEELDFIITTRFDIHFHKEISTIPFDFRKFNALFKEKGHWQWWSKHKFTTDNLYGFPPEMTQDFIHVIDDMYINPARKGCTDLHHTYYRISKKLGKNKAQIISKIPELSDFNTYYSLCRKK